LKTWDIENYFEPANTSDYYGEFYYFRNGELLYSKSQTLTGSHIELGDNFERYVGELPKSDISNVLKDIGEYALGHVKLPQI
jgi:hypothetical protein